MSSLAPFHRVERDAAEFLLSAPADGDHVVHFSEEDATLFEAVGRFLAAGLNAGDRLIVIATPEHQAGFVQHLKGFNVDRAIASGQLLLLDARETLGRFMVNDSPDRHRFHENLNELLARATGGHRGSRVRIYAEGVDLLWRAGLASAAILVEALWNEAGFAHAFSLMCAYNMTDFHERADGVGVADVCRAHSHVLPVESSTFTEGIAKSLLEEEMRRLQERVRSLELENGRLRELERAEHRSSSERLHQGEARFRLLIDSVRDYAIIILDPSGIVATWNPGAERIKGYRAEEIIGRHFSTLYPAEDVEAGKCDRELAVATEVGWFEDEGWRLRKDGSRFWANVVIAPLRGPAGAVIGFAKITRDLTERVAAERERLQLVRMEEAERRRVEFLAIIGHELRNPLAPLVTAAHMIRLRGGRATEKEMGILDRQLRQMTKIVADLVDTSHAMRDTVELSPRVVEIGEVLANAVDLAAPFIEERRHELLIDVPHRSFLVNVDPERMAQVFGNVLHNAAKYTPIGGTIRLHAELRGDEVEVTVEDNGQGIAPHVIGQVFDLFPQGAAGLERAGGGFGIGLAVARKMVREHHGHITAESDGVGHGSRFTIRLPVAAVDPQMAPRTNALPAPRATVVRRVLVADDNRDAAEMMQAMLEQRGHELRLAFDGLEALRVCSEFEPDTVFLDIGLPGMDGYEVARRMRELPAGKNLQIVAVSGYAREEDRARALASGFTAHLAKPVDLDHISKVLES